jgi:hypothetical protein
MADEEDDRIRHTYVGSKSSSFFEALKAETEVIIRDGLIILNEPIKEYITDIYHNYLIYYRQDIDDRLKYGTIRIVYKFEENALPELSVFHLTPEPDPHSHDYIKLYFPLNIAYVQENLRSCFRAWIAQALTAPLGWRKTRFNLFLLNEIQRHAIFRQTMSQRGLHDDAIEYIHHNF